MNYEKKYNEALERARMILCNIPDGSASINDIESIFPELVESEDERMIKAIEHILYENYADAAVIEGVEIAEIVTWLEERKEQKPAEWNPNKEDVILFNKAVTTNPNLTPSERAKLDIIRMKFKHCNGNIATNDFDLALGERYIQGYNDALEESKPAEWSEEDSDNLERIDNYLWMLDDYVGDDSAMPQGKTDKIRGTIQKVLSPWLKSLPERFNLQPKQEWSEEDEKIRKTLLDYYEAALDNYTCVEWLNGITYGELCDWLKSLRPSWKPSEEQMKAFKGYIEDFQARAEAVVGGWNNFDVMIRLYEQLKKLKGDEQ